MRVLQNIHLYPGHVDCINAVAGKNASFQRRVDAVISEGLNGTHLLEPVVTKSPDAFLVSTADIAMQKAWARENGINPNLSPHHILLAQIEAFKPDVLYTQGPGYFPEDVLKQLPSRVRLRIAWQASQDKNQSLAAFSRVVSNFPSYFSTLESLGARPAYFVPSMDPVMDEFCDNEDRPIDIAFIGTYSRHHRARADTLEQIARLSDRYAVRLALSFDKATRIAATPLGRLPMISRYRVPPIVTANAVPPLFGRDMYRLFSQAQLVVNSAIDAAGGDRGNIRCFETMGCGTLLVSDAGLYPEGMVDRQTMLAYKRSADLIDTIKAAMDSGEQRREIARAGLSMMRERYSKRAVWKKFEQLVADTY